jgi:hypothetical protein
MFINKLRQKYSKTLKFQCKTNENVYQLNHKHVVHTVKSWWNGFLRRKRHKCNSCRQDGLIEIVGLLDKTRFHATYLNKSNKLPHFDVASKFFSERKWFHRQGLLGLLDSPLVDQLSMMATATSITLKLKQTSGNFVCAISFLNLSVISCKFLDSNSCLYQKTKNMLK